jgi:hypothetical protein
MKTPWHIWAVGLLTLLWHAGGAYDYLMTEMRNASYLEMIPQDKRAAFMAYLDAMPSWAVATWALGVWGSVAGSVLILLRSRHAVTGFAVALAGLIATQAYTYLLAPASAMSAPDMTTILFTAVICLVLVAALLYARRMTLAGHLR